MTTEEYRKKSPLRIFLHYFGNHKGLFALDIGCATLIALIDLAFPLVTRKSLYDLLPNGKYGVFFGLMIAAATVYVLRAGLNYIVCYFGHTFGIRVEADIREDLFRHMQELSYDFYDANRTGQLMSRLTADLFELTELAHHGPEDLLTSFITMLSGTGGNSGSQSSVTVIRALSLGELEFRDLPQVIWKEIRTAVCCGTVLAAACFCKILLVDRLLMGNSSITGAVALVVCLTMAITVLLAKTVGCILPMSPKRLGFDPAVMASPFITTIVDALSLLVYFLFAKTILGL